MTNVCILDYGSGNVKSVFNLVDYLGYNVKISNSKKDLNWSSHIILPGVGSFGGSMRKIEESLSVDFLKEQIVSKEKQFLGICVGMQVLADKGFEFEEINGLGLIEGDVRKLDSGGLPLPHIGWNEIRIEKQIDLLKNISEFPDFYFVHSYCYNMKNNKYVAASTNYGSDFPSIIQKKNIYGVQFHPEKSQKTGQLLLKNFFNIK